MKTTAGYLIEKQIRKVVTEYYKKLEGVAVLVIDGIELIDLNGTAGNNIQEVDFLIINYSKQYVLNIEAKRSLTKTMTGRRNNRMTVIEKGKRQIEKIKRLIENWFPHLKGTWKYCSMLYCEEEMEEELRNCHHCLNFIAKTPEELLANMKLLDEKMPDKPAYSGTQLKSNVNQYKCMPLIN